MKISLISVQRIVDLPAEEPALGSIASYLRREGHEILVSIIDINSNSINVQEIIDFKPTLIGFTAYNKDKDEIKIISEAIKKEIPCVTICAGGSMPTYYFTEFLQEAKYIDFVVIGEGEITLLEVVKHVESNDFEKYKDSIDGIAFLRNGIVYKTNVRKQSVDMDTLPYMSRDILVKYNMKVAFMNGSRGCLKRCTFCSSRDFWSLNKCNGWKSREITNIVDEIEYIKKTYNIYSFSIQDNSFEDIGVERVMDFAQEIINRGFDISYCFNLRSETCEKFTRNDIALLAKSGVVGIFLGIESGNKEDLKLYGKTTSIENNIHAIKLISDCGIVVNAGFININPYSTVARLLENVTFLHEQMDFLLAIHLSTRLKLFRGTRLYNLCKKEGLYDESFSGEDYRYVTPNMDKFSKHIRKMEYRLYYGSDFPKMIDFFYRFRITLENLKRRIHDHLVVKQLNFLAQTLKSSIKEINDMVVKWYVKLLNIIDNWDDEHAEQITEKYLDYEVVKKYMFKTEIAVNKLIQALETNSERGLFVFQNYL